MKKFILTTAVAVLGLVGVLSAAQNPKATAATPAASCCEAGGACCPGACCAAQQR